MKRLQEGYARFRKEVFPGAKDRFRLLADRQQPEFLFITCSDSRVVPDLIFQTEPGDLFLSRTIGNVVPPHGAMPGGVSATIEYAVEVLRVKHIIVCGHSDCGAVKAAIDLRNPERSSLSRLPLTAQWLGFIEPAWRHLDPGVRTSDPHALHKALIHANVIAQLENLKTHPEVARRLAEKSVEVHGWYYDILSGAVEGYDPGQSGFVALEEIALSSSKP
ncbi:MAG: carbonic anhydrase [Acidobacteriaceae bacterium]